MIKAKNEPIHWAILGPGAIANTFASAMTYVPESVITMVHSSSHQRAQDFATKHGIERVTTDKQALLSDDDIDAIYIAYPHAMHFDAIEQCLISNKHILCEKPLTISVQQAQTAVNLAKQQNVLLMEALCTRFLPAWSKVKQLCNQDYIGSIKEINSSFGFATPFDPQSRLFNPSLGGGALWDIGIYCISMSQFLLQERPIKVVKDLHYGNTNVDEYAEVEMHYMDGVKSNFVVSFNEPLENTFVIKGSSGTIKIMAPFWGSEEIIVDSNNGRERFPYPHRHNGFEYQIEHANYLIRLGHIESPIITWQDSIQTQQMIEDLLRKTD